MRATMRRPPDVMRKGGAMRDRTKYHRDSDASVSIDDVCWKCHSIIDENGECDCNFLGEVEEYDEDEYDGD